MIFTTGPVSTRWFKDGVFDYHYLDPSIVGVALGPDYHLHGRHGLSLNDFHYKAGHDNLEFMNSLMCTYRVISAKPRDCWAILSETLEPETVLAPLANKRKRLALGR